MVKKIKKKKGGTNKKLFGYRFVTMKTKHIDEIEICFQSGKVPIGP
jgi:hypothetical protein